MSGTKGGETPQGSINCALVGRSTFQIYSNTFPEAARPVFGALTSESGIRDPKVGELSRARKQAMAGKLSIAPEFHRTAPMPARSRNSLSRNSPGTARRQAIR